MVEHHRLTRLFFHIGCGRIRLNSESHSSRDDELQVPDEDGTPTDGAPFRGRSKSAPPALWAAKKYGQRLRRMSDEFDTLLDRGVSEKGRRNDLKGREIKGCLLSVGHDYMKHRSKRETDSVSIWKW